MQQNQQLKVKLQQHILTHMKQYQCEILYKNQVTSNQQLQCRSTIQRPLGSYISKLNNDDQKQQICVSTGYRTDNNNNNSAYTGKKASTIQQTTFQNISQSYIINKNDQHIYTYLNPIINSHLPPRPMHSQQPLSATRGVLLWHGLQIASEAILSCHQLSRSVLYHLRHYRWRIPLGSYTDEARSFTCLTTRVLPTDSTPKLSLEQHNTIPPYKVLVRTDRLHSTT